MSDHTPQPRPSVPAMDAILGKPFPCLDHGFVRVIDYMGDDPAIVQAARVSYAGGTRTVRQDRGLLRYLMRHRHTSPLEMCELKLHVKLPIFVARQWIRHRTASVNEISGRYSILKDEFYLPEPEVLAKQAVDNKQGRSEPLSNDAAYQVRLSLKSGADLDSRLYHLLMDDHDLARELARLALPVSTYTEWYWKIDLHNLLHFMSLRLHPHAQREFQEYAKVIKTLLKTWVPLTWEAFVDYRLEAHTFSRQEMEALRVYVKQHGDPTEHLNGVTARERNAFLDALAGDDHGPGGKKDSE